MITSYSRGHEIYFEDGQWLFLDTREPINDERPCKRCGKNPTEEGYDPCLGRLVGAVSACCGHGVETPYFIFRAS
ncbi:MAG: hypothetical protein ACM3U1_01195 [Chloroflexota bacterium]